MTSQGLASLPQCEDKQLISLADAIRNNDHNRVHVLLEASGINPNQPYTSKHPTILHFSIWLDSAKTGSAVSYDIYRLLLQYGCDPNIPDRNGLNCLLYALSYPIIRHDPHSMNKLMLLVSSTRNLNYQALGIGQPTALLAAVRVASTFTIAEVLLSRYRVDPNIPQQCPGRQLFPLSSAMLNHAPQNLIDLILQCGGSPNLAGPNDYHPLFLCMENKKMPVSYLSSLITHNVDVNIKNSKGQSALQVLLQKQTEPPTIRTKIRLLVGANIDVRTPLYIGSVSSEVITLLHYILHDGINSQHCSEQTSEIGRELTANFQENNFEFAKINFHRNKSVRSRIPHSLSGTLSPTTVPRLTNNYQAQETDELRVTSPRASEFSLRFVDYNHVTPLLSNVLFNPLGTNTGGLTGLDLLESEEHKTSPMLSPREAEHHRLAAVPTMNDFETSTSPIKTHAHYLNMNDIIIPPHPSFFVTTIGHQPHPSLARTLSNGSLNSGSSPTGSTRSPNSALRESSSLRGSFQGTNSTLLTRVNTGIHGQRSYSAMSYEGFDGDTVKKLEQERVLADFVDARDLEKIINVAIGFIIEESAQLSAIHHPDTCSIFEPQNVCSNGSSTSRASYNLRDSSGSLGLDEFNAYQFHHHNHHRTGSFGGASGMLSGDHNIMSNDDIEHYHDLQ